MSRVFRSFFAGALLCMSAFGQTPAEDKGVLIVDTNSPDAVVFVDGRALGPAADGPFELAEGSVEISLVEIGEEDWLPRRASATVRILGGQTARVRLELPFRYRIESLPSDAEIMLITDGPAEILGVTPMVLDRIEPMNGLLQARRRGFGVEELAPGDSTVNRHLFVLHPQESSDEVDAATAWIQPRQPRRWIDYAAAGVALAAAGIAVYYKFEADAVDDRYRSPLSIQRGDPLLKQEAERLDLYSLGALGVMQAGLTVLAVRFVLR